jgi:hypothetical protein
LRDAFDAKSKASMGPAHTYAEEVVRDALVELDLPMARDLTAVAIMARRPRPRS